jgi:hypothetical protein
LNNPKDLTLARLIQDPLFQLLEGENIKEKYLITSKIYGRIKLK